MIWNIISYVGAGDLLFGMSPTDVEKLIGKPDKIREGLIRSRRESRVDETMPILYYDEDGLVEITFSDDCKDLQFQGIQVFTEDQHTVFEKIMEIDDHMLGKIYGIVVSIKFGIGFAGFYYLGDSNKSFGCFRRGCWDELITNMLPLPPRPSAWPTEESEESS